MTPLAYLILDSAGRMVDAGGPADQSRFQARVDRWNDGPIDPRYPYRLEGRPYRLVPVAEIPAWQPIETAPRDGSVFILGWPGGRAPGFWCQSFGRFSALPGNAELPPGKMQGFYPFDEWTHWQPLPAPPKEAPDAKS